jgi:hypothetical protein
MLAILLALALVFTGCTKNGQSNGGEAPVTDPSFVLDTQETEISITADNAAKGTGGVGYLTFGENEYLNYHLDGENDEEVLRVVIFVNEHPDNPLAYTDPDAEDYYLDFTVQNSTGGLIGMEPGDYAFNISVDSEVFNGTGAFEVYTDDDVNNTMIPNPWTTVGSVDQVNLLCGFAFNTPETFGGMHRDTEYNCAQELKIASVSYLWTDTDGDWVKGEIRKADKTTYDPETSGSLSGVWDIYDEEKTVDGVQLSLIGGLVRVAEWESDNFRYSIWCQDGLSEKDILAVVDQVE